ncbi:hypothetical protein WMY93_020216 [Mugilogobius chulae]|uniref:Uncharacterized protein n=1 Tax=Mugilogobius chulae TaxID=88201 RepID=A0AAW0NHS0_9GOBI
MTHPSSASFAHVVLHLGSSVLLSDSVSHMSSSILAPLRPSVSQCPVPFTASLVDLLQTCSLHVFCPKKAKRVLISPVYMVIQQKTVCSFYGTTYSSDPHRPLTGADRERVGGRREREKERERRKGQIFYFGLKSFFVLDHILQVLNFPLQQLADVENRVCLLGFVKLVSPAPVDFPLCCIQFFLKLLYFQDCKLLLELSAQLLLEVLLHFV